MGDDAAGARIVVYCGLGDDLPMPPSIPVEQPWISGGIRTLHELAFAIAATGRAVELRGSTHAPTIAELRKATGVSPELPVSSRELEPGSIVFIPEGGVDALKFARGWLSGARVVALLLAPPGLFGWPLVDGWSLPDPLTVAVDDVAREEHFRAMHGLGFAIWTHMPAMRDRVESFGLPCTWIGNGTPGAPPRPRPKTIDVLWLRDNRWAALAERALANLGEGLGEGMEIVGLGPVAHDELLDRMDAARVLVFPSRVEGHSRVIAEARARGCVPVGLSSNRYVVGLTEDGGGVAVDDVDDIGGVVTALLADRERLAALSSRARAAAAEQLDWPSYVARVDAAIAALESGADPTAGARAEMARAVRTVAAHEAERIGAAGWAALLEERARQERLLLEAITAERVDAEADRVAREQQAADVLTAREQEHADAIARLTAAHARDIAEGGATAARLRAEVEVLTRELAALRARRAVRYADGVADVLRRRLGG